MSQQNTDALQKSTLSWGCQWQDLPPTITVGQELVLQCEGSPVSFKEKKIQLSLKEEDKYTLKLLQVKRLSSSEADLVVTSYKVGSHKVQGVQISDGQEFVDINPLQLQVSSVIKDKTQPYGPLGPLSLQRPSWYWPSLTGLLILILFLLLWKWRRYSQRKKAIEKLEVYQTSLSPYNQFNKDFRALERRWNMNNSKLKEHKVYLHDIEETFRMYLIRELFIPAKEWRNKQILTEIQRKKEISQILRDQIEEFLLEIARLSKRDKKDLTALDSQQMSRFCRQLVDGIDKEKRSVV